MERSTGVFQELDVPTAVDALASAALLPAFAAITILDSAPAAQAVPALGDWLLDADIVSDAVVVSSATLVRMTRASGVFVGFDEVWLGAAGLAAPKPRDVQITAELDVQAINRSGQLGSWWETCRLTIGLGDGGGLNVISSSSAVMSCLTSLDTARAHPR